MGLLVMHVVYYICVWVVPMNLLVFETSYSYKEYNRSKLKAVL